MGDPNADGERREVTVPPRLAGRRFDQALAALFPEYSRAQLTRWIRSGHATAENRTLRPRDAMAGGERVVLMAVPIREEPWQPQPIPLSILFADDDLIVIDKPAGLVVHPGAGNWDGTLVNALLHHDPALATVPRAGVVHRLDKDTTGLLVVARRLTSHKFLVDEMRHRHIEREYDAVVCGRVTAGRRVEAPIGRDRFHRTRMAVRSGGRPAATRFRVVERFRNHTLIRAVLETGRTHQIRVHMAYIRHPLVGDPAYGGRLAIPAAAGPELERQLRDFRRQALHARRLALIHPSSGEPMQWETPPPADFRALVKALDADTGNSG